MLNLWLISKVFNIFEHEEKQAYSQAENSKSKCNGLQQVFSIKIKVRLRL